MPDKSSKQKHVRNKNDNLIVMLHCFTFFAELSASSFVLIITSALKVQIQRLTGNLVVVEG